MMLKCCRMPHQVVRLQRWWRSYRSTRAVVEALRAMGAALEGVARAFAATSDQASFEEMMKQLHQKVRRHIVLGGGMMLMLNTGSQKYLQA
jgi:uncharacterized protein YybS (DUF2232 family)